MNSKFKMFPRIFAILILTVCIAGCKTWGVRAYRGEPRSRNDVFLVVTSNLLYYGTSCSITSVRDNNQLREVLPSVKYLECLPGNYFVGINFRNFKKNTESTSPAEIPIIGRRGHVYVVFCEDNINTWRPIVIEISNEKDYQYLTQSRFNQEEIDDVKTKVNDYFENNVYKGRPTLWE